MRYGTLVKHGADGFGVIVDSGVLDGSVETADGFGVIDDSSVLDGSVETTDGFDVEDADPCVLEVEIELLGIEGNGDAVVPPFAVD